MPKNAELVLDDKRKGNEKRSPQREGKRMPNEVHLAIPNVKACH